MDYFAQSKHDRGRGSASRADETEMKGSSRATRVVCAWFLGHMYSVLQPWAMSFLLKEGMYLECEAALDGVFAHTALLKPPMHAYICSCFPFFSTRKDIKDERRPARRKTWHERSSWVIFKSVVMEERQVLWAFTFLPGNCPLWFSLNAGMYLTAVARGECKLRMRLGLQWLGHPGLRMRAGSSNNGSRGAARLAAPRWLPLAPDSVLESFSEYGGMKLKSSFVSSSCSSSSLSSIWKNAKRAIPPINMSSGARREEDVYITQRLCLSWTRRQNRKKKKSFNDESGVNFSCVCLLPLCKHDMWHDRWNLHLTHLWKCW